MEHLQNVLKNMFKLFDDDKQTLIAIQVGLIGILFVALYFMLLKYDSENSEEYQIEDGSPNPQSADDYNEPRRFSTSCFKRRSRESLLPSDQNLKQYVKTTASSDCEDEIMKIKQGGNESKEDIKNQKRNSRESLDMDNRLAIFLSNQRKYH